MPSPENHQSLVELVKQAASEVNTTSTPKVQNTFVIHGGSPVFFQTGMAFHISSNAPVPNKSGS